MVKETEKSPRKPVAKKTRRKSETTTEESPPKSSNNSAPPAKRVFEGDVYKVKTAMKVTKATSHKKMVSPARYGPREMQLAVNAVRLGQSVAGAAKKYSVPRSTLQSKLSGATTINCRRGPGPTLPNYVELELELFCIDMCKRAFPFTLSDLQLVIADIIKCSRFAKDFKNGVPSKSWAYRYLARHPKLQAQKSEKHVFGQASAPHDKTWFLNLEKFVKENNLQEVLIDPRRVSSLAEIVFYVDGKRDKLMEQKYKCLRSRTITDEKDSINFSVNFSAAGVMYPPMIMLKRKKYTPNDQPCVPPGMLLHSSTSGWMKDESFLFYVKEFKKLLVSKGLLNPHDNGQKVFLFIDGHANNLFYNASKYCDSVGIILYCLFPNTKDLQHPADIMIKHFEKKWPSKVQMNCLNNPSAAITMEVFPLMALTAIMEVDKEVLSKSFEICRICSSNLSSIPQHVSQSVALQVDFNKNTALKWFESHLSHNELSMFCAMREVNQEPQQPCRLFEVWRAMTEAVYDEQKNNNQIGLTSGKAVAHTHRT